MTQFPTSIIQNLTGKEYCISVNGQYAVDIAKKITECRCYKKIYVNGQFIGQLEIVIDDDGTYNGRPNKWVSLSFIPVNLVVIAIQWFEDNGFSHCFATIEEEDPQDSDYIPEPIKMEFYIPGKTVKDLKKGEWFTLKPIEYPKDSQVYIKDEYDRETKKYCCGKFSDISYSRLLKGNTSVYVDFTF